MTPKIELSEYDLIIFDLDSTLVRLHGDENSFMPGMKNALKSLPADIKIALASNQGGVGLRRWFEIGGFGDDYDHLPQQSSVEDRVTKIARAVETLTGKVPVVCVSYRFQSRKGNWSTVPAEGLDRDGEILPEWSEEWRKPGPGMLRYAINHFQVAPEKTLMVGDLESDREAAEAAGTAFAESRELASQYFDTLVFKYTIEFLFGWLSREQWRDLDVLSTVARFQHLAVREFTMWEDVVPESIKFVRDDDLLYEYAAEHPEEPARFEKQIDQLYINREWLVYETPEAHVKAMRFCFNPNYQAVVTPTHLSRLYDISYDEASKLLNPDG